MNWYEILLALVVVAALFYAPWRLRQQTAALRAQGEWRSKFFAAAGRLVNDDAVPDPVVNAIQSLAANLDDRRFSRNLFRLLRNGALQLSAQNPPQSLRELQKLIAGLPPGARRLYGEMMSAWVMACTYNGGTLPDYLLGVAIRRAVLFDAQNTRTAGSIVNSLGLRNRPGKGCGPAHA